MVAAIPFSRLNAISDEAKQQVSGHIRAKTPKWYQEVMKLEKLLLDDLLDRIGIDPRGEIFTWKDDKNGCVCFTNSRSEAGIPEDVTFQ